MSEQGGELARQPERENMKNSLVEAFVWLLTTESFIDQDGESEEPTTETRGVEIGNVYSYALAEGFTEDQLDELLELAQTIAFDA